MWAKFGDCAGLPAGPEANVTHKSHERVVLDLRPNRVAHNLDGIDPDDGLAKRNQADPSGILGLGTGKAIVCSHCKQPGHWSLKCPRRQDVIPPGALAGTGSFGGSRWSASDDARASDGLGAGSVSAAGSGSADAAAGGGGRGAAYVPLHLRNAGRGLEATSVEQDHALRITNLSEDATEDDLQALCRPFGFTRRIYLARDRETGRSRGFAFVHYERKQDAEAAVAKLDRHPFDHQVLSVSWADPEPPRPDGSFRKPFRGGGGRGRGGSSRGGNDFGRQRDQSAAGRARVPLALLPRSKK
jgi:translation initiation factor 3 subunit G